MGQRGLAILLDVERLRTVLRWTLAAIYLTAGVFHLYSTDAFVRIVPDWVPAPRLTVIATGCCELVGAVALVTRRLRWLAGLLLALYAVCVYPANIKHAIGGIAIGGNRLGWGYHAPRLAFQPVLVWWALFSGHVIDWPFRERLRKRAHTQ
jgi:uncharacterized membrane protein